MSKGDDSGRFKDKPLASLIHAIPALLAVTMILINELSSGEPWTWKGGIWWLLLIGSSVVAVWSLLAAFSKTRAGKREMLRQTRLPLMAVTTLVAAVGLFILSVTRIQAAYVDSRLEEETRLEEEARRRKLEEYEAELARISEAAIAEWERAVPRLEHGKPAARPWMFLADDARIEGRGELVPPTSKHEVNGRVGALAYIKPTHEMRGYYISGTLVSRGPGVMAVRIVWQVYIIDLGERVVTAEKTFMGPEPPREIGRASFDQRHNDYGFGIEPREAFEKWLAALPTR